MHLRRSARTIACFGLSAFFSILLAAPALAAWSNDPGANLAVADRTSEQVIPLIRSTSDGGVYIAWFDHASGNYDVYLQRLNAAGDEQWPHNGLLVSNHVQNTALFGWDMTVDGSDNAVLVFSDIRDGGDLDTFGYMISPAGVSLWGPDGVQLSINPDFDPAPRVAVASDGDAVFVWQRDPSSGDGDIRMQRVAPDGTVRFAAGGIPVVTSAGEDPGFVQIVPAENGRVILSWLRNIRSFSSPRHLRARKFDAAGAPIWASFVTVYDAFALPIGYFPEFQADGSGGCFLAWHASTGTLFNSFVQHLDAAGAELFPHLGVSVTTDGTRHHISPSLSVDTVAGTSIVFWDERNSTQAFRGIYGQKISAAGARSWGSEGIGYTPLDTIPNGLPHGVPYAGGAMVFLTDEPAGSGTADRLIGLRVDGAGTSLWAGSPLVFSSALSAKSRYPVTIGSDGVAKIAWEDDRNGPADVYAQNVNPNGSIGPADPPGSVGTSLRVSKSALTPGDLRLIWSGSCSMGAIDYGIYEGTLGTWYSHAMKDCSDGGGDRAEEITPSAGNRYYLVVSLSASGEGSYGKDSAGAERPVGTGARCLPAQVLGACP